MAANGANAEARLPQGTIHYRDTGSGEPIVFVHGLLVNGGLWRKVTPALSREFRCIVPDLPLGSHRTPMAADADLSPPGVARWGSGRAVCVPVSVIMTREPPPPSAPRTAPA